MELLHDPNAESGDSVLDKAFKQATTNKSIH